MFDRLAQQVADRDDGDHLAIRREPAGDELPWVCISLRQSAKVSSIPTVTTFSDHDVADQRWPPAISRPVPRAERNRARTRRRRSLPSSRTTRKPIFFSAMIRTAASTLSTGPMLHTSPELENLLQRPIGENFVGTSERMIHLASPWCVIDINRTLHLFSERPSHISVRTRLNSISASHSGPVPPR